MKVNAQNLLYLMVGFIAGATFGATLFGELPGREDRLTRENERLQEELRIARGGKDLPNSSPPAPNPSKSP